MRFITNDFDLLMKHSGYFTIFEKVEDKYSVQLDGANVLQTLTKDEVIDIFLNDLEYKYFLFEDTFLLQLINDNIYKIDNKELKQLGYEYVKVIYENGYFKPRYFRYLESIIGAYEQYIQDTLREKKPYLRKILKEL